MDALNIDSVRQVLHNFHKLCPYGIQRQLENGSKLFVRKKFKIFEFQNATRTNHLSESEMYTKVLKLK